MLIILFPFVSEIILLSREKCYFLSTLLLGEFYEVDAVLDALNKLSCSILHHFSKTGMISIHRQGHYGSSENLKGPWKGIPRNW